MPREFVIDPADIAETIELKAGIKSGEIDADLHEFDDSGAWLRYGAVDRTGISKCFSTKEEAELWSAR